MSLGQPSTKKRWEFVDKCLCLRCFRVAILRHVLPDSIGLTSRIEPIVPSCDPLIGHRLLVFPLLFFPRPTPSLTPASYDHLSDKKPASESLSQVLISGAKTKRQLEMREGKDEVLKEDYTLWVKGERLIEARMVLTKTNLPDPRLPHG